MTDVTRILSQIESGDPSASEQLLPLVYDELRKLAAARLAEEKPGQTLQATALVHDAWLRLIGDGAGKQDWDSRGHFFAAAAETMRRILVENARRKAREKHGGQRQRISFVDVDIPDIRPDNDELLLLDEALTRLASVRPQAAELVKLRFFAGLTADQVAGLLSIPPRSARRLWAFSQAWLRREMESLSGDKSSPDC